VVLRSETYFSRHRRRPSQRRNAPYSRPAILLRKNRASGAPKMPLKYVSSLTSLRKKPLFWSFCRTIVRRCCYRRLWLGLWGAGLYSGGFLGFLRESGYLLKGLIFLVVMECRCLRLCQNMPASPR